MVPSVRNITSNRGDLNETGKSNEGRDHDANESPFDEPASCPSQDCPGFQRRAYPIPKTE
jgi:hypothetical protein